VSRFTSLRNAVTQGRRIGGMSHRAACGWSHVRPRRRRPCCPVRSCGPVPFAVTACVNVNRCSLAFYQLPLTSQILMDTAYGLNSTERVFEICSGATRSLAYIRHVCCSRVCSTFAYLIVHSMARLKRKHGEKVNLLAWKLLHLQKYKK